MTKTNKSRFDKSERLNILQKSQSCLWSDEYGQSARDFLFKERQLSEEIVKQFQIGYVPLPVDHKLAGRVIFPIFDSSENLVALHSRYIHDNIENSLPKWWHEQFDKSFYVYGADIASDSMLKHDLCIVVEGPLDVMQMHNNGFDMTVGLNGTKLSLIQLSVCYRYASHVVLLLDADANQTGQKAAERILEDFDYKKASFNMRHMKKDIDRYGMNSPLNSKNFDYLYSDYFDMFIEQEYQDRSTIQAVTLPESCDPDEYLRKYGKSGMKSILGKFLA